MHLFGTVLLDEGAGWATAIQLKLRASNRTGPVPHRERNGTVGAGTHAGEAFLRREKTSGNLPGNLG